jgi:hypothetical protein
MNARLDDQGRRVTEGAQVDIGHHYVALSRREFGLEQVTPIQYVAPTDVTDTTGVISETVVETESFDLSSAAKDDHSS